MYKLLTVDGWEGEKLKEEDERLVLRRWVLREELIRSNG